MPLYKGIEHLFLEFRIPQGDFVSWLGVSHSRTGESPTTYSVLRELHWWAAHGALIFTIASDICTTLVWCSAGKRTILFGGKKTGV